jgi:3-dehydroquinate synthase
VVGADEYESIEGAGYRIVIGNGALATVPEFVTQCAPAHRYAVISDSRVGALHGARVRDALLTAGLAADLFTFPAGEQHKTRETWAVLTDELLTTGFGRDSTIVAVGGGVVGDLAGFVAATYMRGIPLVHVPTTVVAMVDSAIGGKTGVDAPAGKNLVGSFHEPAGVLVDPEVLATLELRQMQAGLAEVLKHGAVRDASYFREVSEALPGLLGIACAGSEKLRRIIARSIQIKVEIVGGDIREAGIRKILNFGHTLGHAVEAASGYSLLHGEAIAVGMVAEASCAERAGVSERGTGESIRRAVVAAGLPAALPGGVTPAAVLAAARADKKARKGALEYAVPRRIGEMAAADSGWTVRLPDELVLEVLQ